VAESIADKLNRLSRMTVGELRDQWRELMREEPRSHNKAYLYKRLAWQLQAQAFGGLSQRAQARLEELLPLAPSWLPMPRSFTPAVPQARTAGGPAPGTVITRLYKGRTLAVTVREDGTFEFDGTIYASLTAIAKAVTGSHWNGRLFFGLTGKEKAR
jgi:hypothetical protein